MRAMDETVINAGPSLLGPRFEALELNETNAGGWELVLKGRRLDAFSSTWQAPWLSGLEADGVRVLPGPMPRISPEGTSSAWPVSLAPGFEERSLSMPRHWFGRGPERAALTHRFVMRVRVVEYKRDDRAGVELTFRRLLSHLRNLRNPALQGIEFAPQPVFEYTATSDYEDGGPELAARRMATIDLLHASALVTSVVSWRAAEAGRQVAESGRQFEWLACNVGSNRRTHYSAALFGRADSALAVGLADGELLDERRLGEIVGGAGGASNFEFFYGSKVSTSGFVVPCLNWDVPLERLGITRSGTPRHDDTIAVVLERRRTPSRMGAPAAPAVSKERFGAVYLEHLQRKLGTEQDGQYRILWRKDDLPHGGISISTFQPVRKRDAYALGFASFFRRRANRNAADLGPEMGDVARFDRCTRSYIEAFEDELLAHENRSRCLPSFAPAAPMPNSLLGVEPDLQEGPVVVAPEPASQP